jgi:hypothetical protein
MLSAVCSMVVLLAAPAAANASPPTPQSAARIAMKTMPPARMVSAPRRGESTWLPATFSLSHDPGFTPWSSFFSLGHDGVGRWMLEGSSLGGGLRCGDLRSRWCQPLATAMLALAWQPDGSPLAFVAGPSVTSIAQSGEMRLTPGFTAGVRITTASLAAWVQRRRGD